MKIYSPVYPLLHTQTKLSGSWELQVPWMQGLLWHAFSAFIQPWGPLPEPWYPAEQKHNVSELGPSLQVAKLWHPPLLMLQEPT